MKGTDWADCVVCGNRFLWNWETCCSGQECACRGLPIEPAVCSNKCWDKYGWKRKEQKMSRPIKEGDTISVYWTESNDPFTGDVTENVEVLNVPAGIGDFLYVKREDGKVIGINPTSSDLNVIVLEKSK